MSIWHNKLTANNYSWAGSCVSFCIIQNDNFKAMDDIGVVMTPFWDVVTVILVVSLQSSYPVNKKMPISEYRKNIFCSLGRGNDKN